jgi:hypothetical protein
MAVELRPYGVTVVSLYPGLVRTEKVMEAAAWLDLTNLESPEFIGRAVAALAADPEVIRHTGTVLVAASVGENYGFTDIDGKTPRPLTLTALTIAQSFRPSPRLLSQSGSIRLAMRTQRDLTAEA